MYRRDNDTSHLGTSEGLKGLTVGVQGNVEATGTQGNTKSLSRWRDVN